MVIINDQECIQAKERMVAMVSVTPDVVHRESFQAIQQAVDKYEAKQRLNKLRLLLEPAETEG